MKNDPSMPRCKLLQRDVKSEEIIAHTVRGGGRMSMTDKHNWDTYKVAGRIRRLTPTECERLQAYPDGWTKEGVNGPVSDSQRYKCLGNSVTTSVIKAIMERIICLTPTVEKE